MGRGEEGRGRKGRGNIPEKKDRLPCRSACCIASPRVGPAVDGPLCVCTDEIPPKAPRAPLPRRSLADSSSGTPARCFLLIVLEILKGL